MSNRLALLYYANEARMTPQYARILGWLRGSCDEEYREAADRIAEDLEAFPRAVERDLGSLWWGALTDGEAYPNAGLFLLTNRSVLGGKAYYAPEARGGTKPVAFSPPRPQGMQYRLHPLSHPEVLAAALRKAVDLFGADCEFILVAKSHGNAGMAITSLFSAMLEETSEEAFFGELDRLREQSAKGFERVFRPADAPHGAGSGLQARGPGGILGELPNGVGVTKEAFFGSLDDAGRFGAKFSVVVNESCESRLDMDANPPWYFPSNVRRLYTVKEEAPYSSIDYAGTFRQDSERFDDAFASILRPPFARQV